MCKEVVIDKLKKVMCILLVICMALTMSGCGDITKIFSDLVTELDVRFEIMLGLMEDLNEQNIITDEQYDTVTERINNFQNNMDSLGLVSDTVKNDKDKIISFLKGDIDQNGNTVKDENKKINLFKAITGFRLQYPNNDDEITSAYQYFDNEIKEGDEKIYGWAYGVGNFLCYKKKLWDIYDTNKGHLMDNILAYDYPRKPYWIPVIDGNTQLPDLSKTIGGARISRPASSNDDGGYIWHTVDTIEPVVLVDKGVVDSIISVLEYPIYVLNPDLDLSSSGYSLDALKDIKKELKAMRDGGSYNQDIIDKYFVKVTNSNGSCLKEIVKNALGEEYDWSSLLVTSHYNYNDDNTEANTDIVIKQSSEELGVLSIRVQELNVDACTALSEVIGLFNGANNANTSEDGNFGRYLVLHNEDIEKGAIYLLEYPIWAIDKLKEASDNTIEASFKPSETGLNIMTGQVVKYERDQSGNVSMKGTYITEAKDMYLTSSFFTQSDYKENNTSFVAFGSENINLAHIKLKNNSHDLTTKTLRIILRDYLEATYAPGYTEESNLVVFGRKVRFQVGTETVQNNKLVYKRDKAIAQYVNKLGEPFHNEINIDDFCDINYIRGGPDDNGDDEIRFIPQVVGTQGFEAKNKEDISGEPDVSDLKHVPVSEVQITEMFPGPRIDNADFNETDKNKIKKQQRFWMVSMSKGIFKSRLFQEWIESTNTEASLLWWNQYLDDNGFTYNVDYEKVADYLLSSYTDKLQKAGAVILDLETINDIRNIMNKENDQERVSVIRTSFVVLGWALVALALILMLLWVIDTNTDTGLGLLSKVTFGHWIAIKYDNDIPNDRTKGITYLTGGKLAIRCLIIIAVGIALMLVDVFDVVSILIDKFGTAAYEIEKIIKGR